MRVVEHPILGALERPQDLEAQPAKMIQIEVDGRLIPAREGEPIAAALLAAGTRVFRRTTKRNEPRGVYCAIGRCTDCAMTVNGRPNVRTCITPAVDGMVVRTQQGLGAWPCNDARTMEEAEE